MSKDTSFEEPRFNISLRPNYSEREKEIICEYIQDKPHPLAGKEWITNTVPHKTIKIKDRSLLDPDVLVVEIEGVSEWLWMMAVPSPYVGKIVGTDIWIATGFEILIPEKEIIPTPSRTLSIMVLPDENQHYDPEPEGSIDDSSEKYRFNTAHVNPEALDAIVEDLKKDYEHTLVGIGFSGSRFCYIDMTYSEADKKLRESTSKGTYDILNSEVVIIGFDTCFEIYEFE